MKKQLNIYIHNRRGISTMYLVLCVSIGACIAQGTTNTHTGKVTVATNGFGLGFTHYTKAQTGAITTDFQTIAHPQSTSIRNDAFINAKPYVYAKINTAAALRLGYTHYRVISQGTKNSNTPRLTIGTTIGPSIGILKPYYISYQHARGDNSGPDIIQQNEETIQNTDSVYGPVSWTKGLNQLSARVGFHTDLHLAIDWNRSYYFQSCKIGVRIDYFPNSLPIIYSSHNQYFKSVYISYEVGK